VSGDNVAQNQCLADELGIGYAKCIAHALGLLMGHFLDGLPLVSTALLKLSAVVIAGGSDKRSKELASVGVDSSKIHVCTNRFQCTAAVTEYTLKNSETIAKWVQEGETLAALDEDGGTTDGSKALQALRKVYSSAILKPVLTAADMLTGKVPVLVAFASAEHDNVPLDFAEKLMLLRSALEAASSGDGAEEVFFFFFS
jgi:hypothetical protein